MAMTVELALQEVQQVKNHYAAFQRLEEVLEFLHSAGNTITERSAALDKLSALNTEAQARLDGLQGEFAKREREMVERVNAKAEEHNTKVRLQQEDALREMNKQRNAAVSELKHVESDRSIAEHALKETQEVLKVANQDRATVEAQVANLRTTLKRLKEGIPA